MAKVTLEIGSKGIERIIVEARDTQGRADAHQFLEDAKAALAAFNQRFGAAGHYRKVN